MNALPIRLEAAARKLPRTLLNSSGSIFYSGRAAFEQKNDFYILGLNPGGSTIVQVRHTVARHLGDWMVDEEPKSLYLDREWEGNRAGSHGLQPRVKHFANTLSLGLRLNPSSNLIFLRSRNQADLGIGIKELAEQCWGVHDLVLRTIKPRYLICFGAKCGRFLRKKLGEKKKLGVFRETYPNRHWSSVAHRSPQGVTVFTLTHPSRADWTNKDADPCNFVRRIINAPNRTDPV